jgi:hypothetical protein
MQPTRNPDRKQSAPATPQPNSADATQNSKPNGGAIVEGSLTDEEKAQIDLFKYCIDKGFAEATLTYTQVTTILGLQAILTGFVISNLKDIPNLLPNPQMRFFFALGAGAGVFINLTLFFVTRKSIKYNRDWMADAATLRTNTKVLSQSIQRAVATPGLAAEPQSWLHRMCLAVAFWQWRATTWFLVLAVILCGVWCGVLWAILQYK